MTVDDVVRQIGPERMDALARCVKEGTADYDADESALKHDHSHRTICSIRHDCIIKRVKQMVLEEQGMRYCEVNGKNLLVIDDRIWVSFNLLGKDYLVRANDTKQAEMFLGQGVLLTEADSVSVPSSV